MTDQPDDCWPPSAKRVVVLIVMFFALYFPLVIA